MKSTKPLWFLIGACLLGLWLYTDFDLLPTPYELVLEPESEVPAPGSGTAFSIGDGVWMTARHVVNNCDGVGFIRDRKLIGVVERTVHHNTADLSLLFSDFSAPSLPIARPEQDPNRHETAFFTGFPAGQPRSFLAAQVEYRTIERFGAEDRAFPIIVWAEQPPPAPGTVYSGMSGGPVINGAGAVVGVLVGADNALGRIVANVPETLRQMMADHGVASTGNPVTDTLVATPSDIGAALRQENRVVEVYCHVE